MNLMGGTQLLPLLPREQFRERIVDDVELIMSDPELVNDRSKIRNRTPFRSLSLGAGVQSTVLALMAEHGGIRTAETGRSPFLRTPGGSLPAFMNTWTGSASSCRSRW